MLLNVGIQYTLEYTQFQYRIYFKYAYTCIIYIKNVIKMKNYNIS